jgi:hypothetical protein
MVTSVWRVAGEQVDAAQREGPSPRPGLDTLISWRTSLPPAFMTKSVSLASLPITGIELAEMRRRRLLLHDEPGEFGAVAERPRRLTELTSALSPAGLRSTTTALAPAPTRTGKAHMRLAAAWMFCNSIGLRSSAPVGDVDKIAVGTKAR